MLRIATCLDNKWKRHKAILFRALLGGGIVLWLAGCSTAVNAGPVMPTLFHESTSTAVAGNLSDGFATPPADAAVATATRYLLSTPPAKSFIPGDLPVYGYRIVHSYPHDVKAFTEGLVFFDDALYESTGLTGESSLRRVDLASGAIVQLRMLDPDLFGEGLALINGRLVQLTWKNQRGLVYDVDTFELLTEFTYPTEGWGLASDGQRLVMSDGTATLRFLDPVSFEETGHITVRAGGNPVLNINELEFVEGRLFANIWKTNWAAIIDPDSGATTGWVNLEGLLSEKDRQQPVDVLNGIAYDSQSGRLFVTGKFWPKVFEIAIDDQ
jgi:glutamine cyclotransferase